MFQIKFFSDEAIRDDHINWKKKNLKGGTIDWYIQGTIYHIYNANILNITHQSLSNNPWLLNFD